VLEDYNADSASEVTLRARDKITVLEKTDGWWYCSTPSGTEGWYVRPFSLSHTHTHSHSLSRARLSGLYSSSGNDPQRVQGSGKLLGQDLEQLRGCEKGAGLPFPSEALPVGAVPLAPPSPRLALQACDAASPNPGRLCSVHTDGSKVKGAKIISPHCSSLPLSPGVGGRPSYMVRWGSASLGVIRCASNATSTSSSARSASIVAAYTHTRQNIGSGQTRQLWVDLHSRPYL
jgi:hypothetical protein